MGCLRKASTTDFPSYNGKSTGVGALGLWMHHMKDIDVVRSR